MPDNVRSTLDLWLAEALRDKLSGPEIQAAADHVYEGLALIVPAHIKHAAQMARAEGWDAGQVALLAVLDKERESA